MEQNIKNNNLLSILLTAWWVTLPIGAFFSSLDIGPVVIYPNLICSLLISVIGLKSLLKWNKIQYLYILFLALWSIQGFFQFIIHEKTSLALFDLRSLIMQMVTAFVLFSSYQQLGKEQFLKIVIYGLRYYLIILIISGIFESYTGIHIVGTFTEKLVSLSVANVHYAPVFLFDNPNDFVAHYLFLVLFIIFYDRKWASQKFLMLTLLVIAYYFAFMADSVFGKAATVLLGLMYLSHELLALSREQKFWVAGAFVIFIILFLTNPLFIGPRYKDSEKYRINGIASIIVDSAKVEIIDVQSHYSLAEQKRIYETMDSLERHNPVASHNIRKNLILNSIDFIKESPLVGIGPGQYYQRHIDNQVKYNTDTVTSAHCFPLEIISVYGISGWIYLIFIGFIFVKILMYRKKLELSYGTISCCLAVLGIIWLMPSSFLYLEIQRLTIPLLILLISTIKKNDASEC